LVASVSLPSPLHDRGFSYLHGVSTVSRAIVEGFVGFVFTVCQDAFLGLFQGGLSSYLLSLAACIIGY